MAKLTKEQQRYATQLREGAPQDQPLCDLTWEQRWEVQRRLFGEDFETVTQRRRRQV